MMSLGFPTVKLVFEESLGGTMIIPSIKGVSGDRNMSLLLELDDEVTCHMNHRPKHTENQQQEYLQTSMVKNSPKVLRTESPRRIGEPSSPLHPHPLRPLQQHHHLRCLKGKAAMLNPNLGRGEVRT